MHPDDRDADGAQARTHTAEWGWRVTGTTFSVTVAVRAARPGDAGTATCPAPVAGASATRRTRGGGASPATRRSDYVCWITHAAAARSSVWASV